MKTEAVLTAAAAAAAAAADSEAATTAQVPACVSVHTKTVCAAQFKTSARCHCILQLMHWASFSHITAIPWAFAPANVLWVYLVNAMPLTGR